MDSLKKIKNQNYAIEIVFSSDLKAVWSFDEKELNFKLLLMFLFL